MQICYDAAETFTLVQEEGRQSAAIKGDPGRATNWGITIFTLSGWLGRPATDAEVYALTLEQAGEIFHAWYWNSVRGARLWWGLDLFVADHGFNSGTGDSVRVLQRVLGFTGDDVDGRMGPQTLGAAGLIEARSRLSFLGLLRDAQGADYRADRDFPEFGKEWIGDPTSSDPWRNLGRLGRRMHAATQLLAKYQTSPPSDATTG